MTLLFVDTETTGLVVPELSLLEVALVITDDQLEVKAQSSWFVPGNTQEGYAKAVAYVRNMHTHNGLWQEHYAAQPCTDPSDAILTWCYSHGISPGCGGPMVGNGIAYDQAVLNYHLPRVRALWNHRVLDISGMQLLAEMWGGLKYTGAGAHRALDDALESVVKLRWLRQSAWRI